jgi:hypothetical protein
MATAVHSKPGVVILSGGSPWVNESIISVAGVITLSGLGTPIEGNLITLSVGTMTLDGGSPYTLLELFKKNFIAWSRVGYANFTLGIDNVAGERPLDWKGWVYSVKKLGKQAVAYGENGVTLLTQREVPVVGGITYQMNTVYRVGLMGKQAITGTNLIHFFIDNKGQLFKLAVAATAVEVRPNLEKLDYSEYLSVLTDPVLSYDEENDFVYICDGTYGFVYSHKDKSLGEGPINVTGIGSQGGTQYIVSPATVVTPNMEICTDIYDMETRAGKAIESVELGVDIAGALQVAIDWRVDKSESFTQTSWYTTDLNGYAFIRCYGHEFRFRVRNLAYEWVRLDYIKINGEVFKR